MKKRRLKMIFFLGIIIFTIIVMTQLRVYPIIIRPIEVKVVDSVTKTPIKGLLVYYVIDTTYVNNILGIPIFEPIYYEERLKNEYFTNNEGKILIKRRIIFRKIWEKLGGEQIYINLEIKDNFINNRKNKIFNFLEYFNIYDDLNSEKFYNPNFLYKGYVIASTFDWKYDVAEKISKKGKYSVLWNSKSFKKDKEELLIELERWDEGK